MEPTDRESNKTNSWFKSLRRKKSANKDDANENIDTSVVTQFQSTTSATRNTHETQSTPKSTNSVLNSWMSMFRKRTLHRRRCINQETPLRGPGNRLLSLQRRANVVANDYVDTDTELPELDIPANQMYVYSHVLTPQQQHNFVMSRVHALSINRIESPWVIPESSPNLEYLIMLNAQVLMNNHGWYRGGISRTNAQKKLQGQPDGSFLLRNSQTSGTHFTLSFRSAGITLHYRIQYENGYWSIESSRYVSIVEMIEDAMRKSKNQIFCYVKPGTHNILQPPFPVRLTNPISKFEEVPKLQHICRYYIRTSRLPLHLDTLPKKLQDYVKENKYLNIHYGYFEDVS